METTAAAEGYHQSHNSNIVSKSVGSLIKIDSISIDLVSDTDAIDTRKCEHFSIRGYVSEMRMKDWKKGWPFALDINDERSEEQTCMLPAIAVPKFRCWMCQNCQRQMGAENVAKTNGAVLNCCGDSLKPVISPCSQGSPLGDTVTPTSFQNAPKVNIVQVVGVDSNPSANVASKDSSPSKIGEKTKEKAPNNSNKGNENGLEDNKGPNLPVPTYDAVATSSQIQVFHKDQKVRAVKSYCNEYSAKAGTEEAINSKKSSGQPSWELEEEEYASLDKSVSLSDKSAGLSRKRTRKVRLMRDLLAGDADSNTDIMRTEDSPPISISDAAGVVLPSPSQRRPLISENPTSIVTKSKKRKYTQDEEWRLMEESMPSHVSKKEFRALSTGAGTNDRIANSSADEDTLFQVGFLAGCNAHISNSRIEKNAVMEKKRHKEIKVSNESLSTEPLQENVVERIHERVAVSDKIAATDKGKGPLTLPVLRIERSLSKKRNKKHQGNNELGSLVYRNNGIIREDPSQLAPNASTDQGWNLSLSSHTNAQGCNREAVPQVSGVRASLTSLQEGAAEEGQTKRKGANISFTHGSQALSEGEPDAHVERGFFSDLNSKKTSHKIPSLHVKKKHVSQSEGGCRMDSGGTSNSGKTTQIQEAASTKLDEQGDESIELMEIVELMAKNQYERGLPDGDCHKQPSNLTKNTQDGQLVDLNEAYVDGDLSSLQEDGAQGQKSSKNAEYAKQKTVDYLSHIDRNHLSVSRLEQIKMLSGVTSFSQYQEKLPTSGVQCFPISSSGQVSGHNRQWLGNAMGSSSHSSFPPRVYAGRVVAPEMSDSSTPVWPPSMQPFGYSIPQHASSPVNKVNVNGNHSLNFLRQNAGSFDKRTGDFDSETLRKKCVDQSFTCKHTGMGLMNLHSKDNIPATDLLKFMHAHLSSGSTNDANRSSKFFERTHFPYTQNSKEFSGLPFRTDSMKHPRHEYGKLRISENSNEYSASIPTAVASNFSFDHCKSLKKATDFENQVSFKSRGKGKLKIGNSQVQHSMLLGFEDSGNPKKHKWAAPSATATVQPREGFVQCSINRNPADFSLPDESNEHMIAGEDLKLRMPVFSENKAGLTKLDGHKRLVKGPKGPGRRQMS